MRQLAVRAVLKSLIRKLKIPATVLPQRIQRAITKQTIKVLRVCPFMTGEEFTFFVAEIRIMFSFPIRFFHRLYLHDHFYIKKLLSCTSDYRTFPSINKVTKKETDLQENIPASLPLLIISDFFSQH